VSVKPISERRLPMLQVRSLDAFYGKSQILRHLDLDVREKEIVSVLGRNGSGRRS